MLSSIGSFAAEDPGSGPMDDALHFAVTRHYVEQAQDNQLLTVSLVNGLGSTIQLKKTMFANSNTSDQLRWLISCKEERDAFGRVIRSYLPTTQLNYPVNSNNLLVGDF